MTDAPSITGRIAAISRRLYEVATWMKLSRDLLEDAGADIISLEEKVEAQAKRIARLEAMLGVAIERREVRG